MSSAIISKKADLAFIILPSFLVISFVILANMFGLNPTGVNPIWWLLVVVFIDVSHVWSTLFRTYFHKMAYKEFEKELVLIPIIVWTIGSVIHSYDGRWFWCLMAYMALFHFVKQQIGILKLYLRREKSEKRKAFDVFCLYLFILAPIIHWHLNTKKFNWFVAGDFFSFQIPYLENITWFLYGIFLLAFIISEIIHRKTFNGFKFMHIIGTLLIWLLGIVIYDDDWSFTLTNIVHHGIPYMALIWFSTYNKDYQGKIKLVTRIFRSSQAIALIFFILFLGSLGFLEEFLWDGFVWHDHDSVFFGLDLPEVTDQTLAWLVPLLSVPQITHYVLDGIIWKRDRKVQDFPY